MNDADTRDEPDGIAIVGMAARMPGAPDLDTFWRNLRDGVESISHFSEAELLESGLDLATIRHPNFVPAKGVLAEVEMFDAAFFGISPREAEFMDPQHRLLMECAWEAMEHAGYDSEAFDGRVAVFTSAGMNTYLPFNILSNPGLADRIGGFQLSIYNDKDFVPTRIAYSMNLKGPGVDIGTACSSSLVSLHFACQSLMTYQCDMALVGAVSVHFPLKVGHLHEEGTAYSPDGHCRPFDATPSGLIDGNGLATIVLKRLADALSDGDTIHAVIKGTAINNDGSMKVGYAAPSVEGQAQVIVEAQAAAGCDPETISYVEAHGTATPLGDPIEVAALTQAFRAGTDKTGFCGLGSVKSNIGHVDKAAGLAGLIKTTLALKHGVMPPSLHFKAPNPKLKLEESPFYVVNAPRPWPRIAHSPRRAGISSFGVGGTNAHAVIEEAPLPVPGSPSRPVQLLMVSAKTEAALEAATENLAAFLERDPDVNLSDVCHTSQRGRRAFAWRRAVVCRSTTEAVTALRAARPSAAISQTNRDVAFMFPGQGSQYPGMGRELYRDEPVFREQIDLCAHLLEPELGFDIRKVLFPEANDNAAAEQLARTALTQPALFTIEYALARLWMDWGLHPRAMIGHSLGEYVAACVAGVFSLPDALSLIAARGRLMQQLPPGAMLAVPLAEATLRPLLPKGVDLAAVNGPELCVISGDEPAVAAFRERLTAQGLTCPRLHTSHAFHSAMMSPMVEPFIDLVRRIERHPPRIPFISNLTGQWITDAEATRPEYWAEQSRHAVRFADGLACLLGSGASTLLEVGPGRTLTGLAANVGDDPRPRCLASLPGARERHDAGQFLARTLADLWTAGVGVDWTGYYRNERRLRVPLPTYPFQRHRHWVEPGKRSTARETGAARRDDVADWFYLPSWKATLPPAPRPPSETTSWLIFRDAFGVATALGEELERLGHTVINVETGAEFSRENARNYVVNPADVSAVCDDLFQRDALPRRIVWLWGLGGETILSLVRALDWLMIADPIELIIVGDTMCDVDGETLIDPAKAVLLGPCLTIQWEYSNLTCRAIDVPSPGPSPGPSWSRGLIGRLRRELQAPPTDRIVALRAGRRLVADLNPVRLETADGLLRQKGVYLIIGGLTDVGLCLAREVAELSQAKLILTTVDNDPSPRLQELEALGCEILPIFNSENLEDAFARGEARFGRIDGVIHATDMSASRPSDLMRDLDADTFDHHWREQREAIVALEQCLQRRDVDFCMVMSSLASEVGGMGQLAHTTAGLYIDALARRQDPPWIVVNWDLWRADDEPIKLSETLAGMAMTPAEGANAFRRILQAGPAGRILVSATDPRFRQEAIRDMRATTAAGETTNPNKSHQRPDLPVAHAPPRDADEAAMAELWRDVLGIDGIGIHDNFFDLGGHSLLATQLVSRLRQSFQASVELDMFFSAPTIAELTEAVLSLRRAADGGDEMTELLDKLEAMTDEQAEALLNSGELPETLLAAWAKEADSR